MGRGVWWAAAHGVVKSRAWLSDFTFTFHFRALEKEMAAYSSVLLKNPRYSGVWWAAVCGVAQSRTQLKRLSSSSSSSSNSRDLFEKIRDTKGRFYAKMGSIKDRNCLDQIEAEDIKKRWQEYTEELYKKDLHDSDNHDGVITHLEADIQKCEVGLRKHHY